MVWIFWIELSGSILTLILLGKELKGFANPFDKATCKRMLSYTWPLLVMGLAGQLNQCASQIIFPYVFNGTAEEARVQLGIYGACIKIAMIMVMITQAFRYAYEPFVFGQSKEKNSKETYAKVMKYYIIFTLLAFLCVISYMDLIRYIVGRSYWEGLEIVPIVMAAEIMFGVFFNLSFWYKLIDKTIWGAYFSGIGAAVLIAVDIIFIPLQLLGMCLGRIHQLHCEHGTELFLRTEILPHQIPAQEHCDVCRARPHPLRRHDMEQRGTVDVGFSWHQHASPHRLCRLCREA